MWGRAVFHDFLSLLKTLQDEKEVIARHLSQWETDTIIQRVYALVGENSAVYVF